MKSLLFRQTFSQIVLTDNCKFQESDNISFSWVALVNVYVNPRFSYAVKHVAKQ